MSTRHPNYRPYTYASLGLSIACLAAALFWWPVGFGVAGICWAVVGLVLAERS